MPHPSDPRRAGARRPAGDAGRVALALLLALAIPRAAGGNPGAPEDRPPEQAASQQEVVRTETGFTVRASNGSLPEILAEIGGQAGFDVVDSGKSYPAVTVAIEDTPLDSLLHQLLRGVNFFILYKGGGRGQSIDGRGIDRIVLLTSGGAGGTATAAAPPARAGRVSPLAGTKTGKPAPAAQPAPVPQPDDGTAALAAAAAAANDAGGSEILRRLRAARAARSGGMEAAPDPNLDTVTAAAAAALAQHSGGQVDPSVLEAARLAAQRAMEANGGSGFGNQGFGNQGDPGPMDDALYPDE